jgi:2-polyprenyl-6-methoxyphenol hydroxylase-like FAD-dependent oxidoreductase
MIPPFTGNGMSMAFEAAEAALEPMVAYAAGQTRWSEVVVALRERLRLKFRKRLVAARLLHPFLLSVPGHTLLALTARTGLLPFNALFRLLR